jgi:signal transduction histidine kinase
MGAVFGFRSAGAEPFSTLDELAVVTLALQTAAHVARVTGREHLQRLVLLEERHRIAAELHAGIVDELRALARDALAPGDGRTPAESEALRGLGARLLSLADGVDDYSAALSSAPRALSGDLSSDLATLLRQAVPDGVDTILRVNLNGLTPSARLAEDIVFIVREAVTNSVRHGSPSKIAVDLRESGGSLVLAVQDDGIGLDVDHRRPGIGLLALQNRVERSAGVLNLVGLPGMGTLVYVTFSPESPGATGSS